jgi:hypothetical protein
VGALHPQGHYRFALIRQAENIRGRLKTIWATFYFYAFWGLLLVLLDNPPNGQWSKSGETISISPSSLF